MYTKHTYTYTRTHINRIVVGRNEHQCLSEYSCASRNRRTCRTYEQYFVFNRTVIESENGLMLISYLHSNGI